MDWTSLISGAFNLFGAKRQASATEKASTGVMNLLAENAKPKTMYGPMGGAYWDDVAKTYGMELSPNMAGLFSAYMDDVYRQRGFAEPYMRDPEAAAKTRYDETMAAIAPQRERATETLLSRLHKGGLLGSTVGAGMASEVDRQNLIADAGLMAQARSGVQSDINTYLTRAANAQNQIANIGSIPNTYANQGINQSGVMVNALSTGAGPMLESKIGGIDAAAQPWYQLGDYFGGLQKQPPSQGQYDYSGNRRW